MGQYPTPAKIIDAILSVLKPTAGSSVTDPACGHGNIVSRFVEMGVRTVHGFDIDSEMVRSTIERVGKRAVIIQRDVLKEGLPQQYDFIIANPPFSPDRPDTALRFQTGSKHPAAQFVELCLNHLAPGGRLAIVLDRGLCSSEKHYETRSILMKQAYIDMIVELGESAFRDTAGTDFSTLLLFFRHTCVSKTQFGFSMGKRKPDPVDYQELLNAKDWFYGPYKYRHYVGTRLGDFVELVNEQFTGGNQLNPVVDPDGRFLKNGDQERKKVRKCMSGCLYMPRLTQEESQPKCAVITDDFDGAGTTREFYILRPKDSGDLPWLWYVLNTSANVQDYMHDMARGMALKRVLENDFLAMPMVKPDRDKLHLAVRCLSNANEIVRLRTELQRDFSLHG